MSYGHSISLKDAAATEKKFIKIAEKNGYTFVRKATRAEDIRLHWDLMFTKGNKTITVDVKSHKKKYRGGPPLQGFLLVEWNNVGGNNGWLLGQADEIAFEYFDEFYVFNRQKLMNYAFMVTDFSKRVKRPFNAINCIYQREGRKDQMSLLETSSLVKAVRCKRWPI